MRHGTTGSCASVCTWNDVSRVEEDGDELGLCWMGEAAEGELRHVKAWKRKIIIKDHLFQGLKAAFYKNNFPLRFSFPNGVEHECLV